MSRFLVIAEKPSVAGDLARVLGKQKSIGKFTRDKSGLFYENDYAVITSAVGHLLEQSKPTTLEGKPLPWKMDVLPMIPDDFRLEPMEKTSERLNRILRLAKLKDIDTIVNACDAGREGELIFRNMERYGQWKKPIKRLWMQSMTDDSIVEAWQKLRSDADMKSLADAAICRSESDWLVGLNSTRALTVLQSRGGFNITPAGRVQTPTLAILVKRELEIQSFIPTPYTEVIADFAVSRGSYTGKWIDTAWEKNPASPESRAERITDPSLAEAIKNRCEGKTGVATEETKTVRQIAPQLYDLTSLQRDAAGRFGFSAKRTLQLAQECYEKHKVLTYPRTDSRYLPEDYKQNVTQTVRAIAGQDLPLSPFASLILDKSYVTPNKRIFDNSKVSDHFAIIPTGRFENLSGDVQRIFDLVTARFLAVFYPPAEFEDTKRTTTIAHPDKVTDTFSTTGRILVEPGWLAVYGRKPGSSKEDLTAITQGESAKTAAIRLEQNMTKPPARYNEATLLSAMEGAGKTLDDEELREAMRERGLGTPATRAAIIEGLITQKYIARDGRDFIVSRHGIELIDLLKKIKLETLTSPELTGDWEHRLKLMEQGKLDRPSFMTGIKDLTREIVERIKKYTHAQQHEEQEELRLPCPACHAPSLRTTMTAYSCRTEGCKFTLNRNIAGHELTDAEVKSLLTTGKTEKISGFKSRFGKLFDAALVLNEKFKANFAFDEKKEDENAPPETFTPEQNIGTFAILNNGSHPIYELERTWRIPSLVLGRNTKGLTINRAILEREIPRDQLVKILTEGKSDLLRGFVSQKSKRAFDAYLVFDSKAGKLNFEFEPRAPKKPAGSSPASSFSTKKSSSSSPASKASTTKATTPRTTKPAKVVKATPSKKTSSTSPKGKSSKPKS